MAPGNKRNVIFKISLYGLPTPDTYQGDRLAIFLQASEIAQVPLIYRRMEQRFKREAV